MKLSLYNIEQEYLTLTEQLLENGGEVTPEMETALAINANNLKTKAINYGFVIKHLDSECDIIDKEIERLQGLKKSRVNSIARLKETVTIAMRNYEIDKIESPVLKLSFRASEQVVIDNENDVPYQYQKIKTTATPDKAAIKEAILAGEIVIGAHIQTNLNLQIK